MRSTNSYKLRHRTCLFRGDTDRGCLVVLPSGREMDTDDMGDYDTPYIDPDDGQEVFYPGWASW